MSVSESIPHNWNSSFSSRIGTTFPNYATDLHNRKLITVIMWCAQARLFFSQAQHDRPDKLMRVYQLSNTLAACTGPRKYSWLARLHRVPARVYCALIRTTSTLIYFLCRYIRHHSLFTISLSAASISRDAWGDGSFSGSLSPRGGGGTQHGNSCLPPWLCKLN